MSFRRTTNWNGWTCRVAIGLILGLAVTTPCHADQWPQFRGAASSGIAQSSHPTQWSQSENVAWSKPIAGEGWSCPIIWDGRVYLTTAVPSDEQTDDGETGPEEYRGGGGRRRDDLTKVNFNWQVICLDATTGREVWRQTIRKGTPTLPRHSSNTYATETPLTDGKRIYVYIGMMGLYCLDLDGNPVWQTDLGSYSMRAGWGTSSSPVLFDGKLFVQVDNEQQSFLAAIDTETGEELWRVAREEKSQYSSPIVWQNSLRNEVIVGGMHYRSYDPQTGKLLWELDMEKGRSSATPVADGDRLYVGTEFRNRGGADDGGGFLMAVKPGGSGDISPPEGSSQAEFIAWKIPRSGIQMASPVVCNGKLYLLERRSGVLHCVSAESGETVYRVRIPGARAFWASPWVNDDKVFCVDTGGTTHVIDGGAEFKVLTTNDVDEQTWSTPAIADGRLYLRTITKLYCISNI